MESISENKELLKKLTRKFTIIQEIVDIEHKNRALNKELGQLNTEIENMLYEVISNINKGQETNNNNTTKQEEIKENMQKKEEISELQNILNKTKSFPTKYVKWLERAKDVKISKNFTLYELAYSNTAMSENINNIPNNSQITNGYYLIKNVVQPIRDKYGITKAYSFVRVNELNKAIGGTSNSQHIAGEAIDVEVVGYNTRKKRLEIIKYIVDNLEFDQIILEPAWIHVSYSSQKNRKQVLEKVGSKYILLKV